MSSTPASLWLRVAAGLYDLFPLIALWMLTAGVALLAVRGEVDLSHPSFGWQVGLRTALVVVTCAYFVISWARGGQTIGMRAWRLLLVDASGRKLSWPRCVLRFAIACISLGALGLGFLWCLVDARNRAWHDLVARSVLVRLEK